MGTWSLRLGFLLALCAYHSVSESKPPNTPCERSNVGAESLLHTPKSYCEGRNMELPKRPCRSLLVGEGMIRKELSLNPVGTLAGPLKGVFLLLMDKLLHDPKDPKLWEIWYIPYNG